MSSPDVAAANPFRLPSGTILLAHQVAGHVCEEGKDTIGILQDHRQPGTILKAANKPVCGQREIAFYQRIQAAGRNDTNGHRTHSAGSWQQLRQLTPQFHGIVTLPVAERNVDFVRLQDLTDSMLEPCVMDVKIGARTWDPMATQEKIDAERQKYSDCKQTLGFCIPGFQVFDVVRTSLSTDGRTNVRRYGKEFGKSLNPHNLRDALLDFLNASDDAARTVHLPLLLEILDGLAAIRRWATTQNQLRLYSSSILLAYDAAVLRRRPSTASAPIGKLPGADVRLRTQVKMIDFAHAFDVELCADSREDALDRNYADGVTSLMGIFEGLLPTGVAYAETAAVNGLSASQNGEHKQRSSGAAKQNNGSEQIL